MHNFLSLLKNEHIKLYSRFSTWTMYIILGSIILISGLIVFFFSDVGIEEYGADWKTELQAENEEYREIASEDEFMEGAYDADIAKNEFYIQNDMKPASYDAWQLTLENAGLSMLITLFTIIVSAGIVASEFRWGTIKLLLIRPISRSKILLSKYVTVLLFAISMLVFLFIFNLLVGAVFFGMNGVNPSIVQATATGFEQVSIFSEIIMEYGLSMVNLIIMTTFAFMISTLFKNSGMAIGLAIFLMFAGNTLVGVLSQYEWSKFILFANTNLRQYTGNGTPLMEGMTLGFSVTVLIIYYTAFLLISWLSFTKRDIAGS
ncbi:ABC transporter permease [Gracilibacillus oryzae]|uniref:ABC transporter permease n=1 Tax=Gracilibacillus oryzae TaxID=1672701 RepID=A0A7C8KR64_9BACI|nr:ABC transporter permease [Gracilibacillus oryzae]KAB8137903.1 ABC transporter permease [Gracilibacillus oryzae]